MRSQNASASSLVLQRLAQPQKTEHGEAIKRHERVERELQRMRWMTVSEKIAHRTEERRAEPETDQIHYEQQQRTGQYALVRPHLLLHEGDGRRQIEIVQKGRNR